MSGATRLEALGGIEELTTDSRKHVGKSFS
jgi:hypothetical protein